MTQYARYIDETTVQYPTDEEFAGIVNWRFHDGQLRKRHYVPMLGEAEEREGYVATPSRFADRGDHIDVLEWVYSPASAPAQPDTTERDNAEKAIVAAIAALARKYDATADIEGMEDITIPNLTALADAKGVPASEFGALITELTPYKWQLEAVTGLLWAECWEGLKSRFAQWMREIASPNL